MVTKYVDVLVFNSALGTVTWFLSQPSDDALAKSIQSSLYRALSSISSIS